MLKIIDILSGGKITSTGRADEVVEMVKKNSKLTDEVFNLFFDTDPIIAMRSSYVFMKLSKSESTLILPFKSKIIENLNHYNHKEVRWHIPQILLVMELTTNEAERAYTTLMNWAEGKDGNIVVYYSLEAAYKIAKNHLNLMTNFLPRLKNINKTEAKIVKNRCKKIAEDLKIKLN
jgi:hypothetical protein